MRSPSYNARTSSPSRPCAQSLRIAIASSIPPSHASRFWNTWSTTRGWRPSRRSASRAWLKYASVYQPARILSTGRSKISGGSRVLSVCAMLELEAGGERGLCDLELLRRRLRRRKPVLKLVAGLRQRLRDEIVRMPGHPAEDLRRRGERTELSCRAGAVARALRRKPGEQVADGRRRDQRADQMPAAALVLLLRAGAVLVVADRDVLGAVVGGELRAAHCERSRRDREQPGDELLRGRAQTARLADALYRNRGADHRHEHARPLHR